MPRPKSARTERFNMMISLEERHVLDGLATAAGVDASTFLRDLLLAAAKTRPQRMLTPSLRPAKLVQAEGEAERVALNRAKRGEALDDIVRFAESLESAGALWRKGDVDEAVDQMLAAQQKSDVVGKLSVKDWKAFLEEHVSKGARQKAQTSRITTTQLVLKLLDFETVGDSRDRHTGSGRSRKRVSSAGLPSLGELQMRKLDDGRPLINRTSVVTRLGKWSSKRRAVRTAS